MSREQRQHEMPKAPSAPEQVQALVNRAEAAGVSDIHLQRIGQGASIAFRLDGVMRPIGTLEEALAERVFGRIKYLARLKTYQDSLPQDGRINRDDVGSQRDIRVSTYPTVTGEKIVLRLFDQRDDVSLDQLGFDPDSLAELRQFLGRNGGLLLLTGPAGSGKTTTIYACLRELAGRGDRHVITVEDPVEQLVPGIMQTETNEARGLNFATAARHLLRQDPEVLVIGEIRDEETANIAVRAALTGHSVIATLHAGSCGVVFDRLLNLSSDPYAAINSVALVMNQRLVRRLCVACAGEGCPACLQTGFKGRIPVVEWIRPDDAVRDALKHRGPISLTLPQSLRESAARLVDAGLTHPTEIERVLN